MGSSYIEYQGFGFWSRDAYIESWLLTLMTEMRKRPEPEPWQSALMEHWHVQIEIDGGCMSLDLDEFLIDSARERTVLSLAKQALPSSEPHGRRTGELLIQLLEGQLRTNEASLVDYLDWSDERETSRNRASGDRDSVADESIDMFKPFLEALDVFEDTGSIDEAFQYIERIDDWRDRESTFKKMAKYLARHGDLDQARRFSDAIHEETGRIQCLQEIARDLRRKGRGEAGERFLEDAYQRALKFNPDDSDTAFIFFSLSIELYDFGRVTDALVFMRRAIRLESQNPDKILSHKLLWGCSIQLAKWGFRQEARTVAESIQEESFRKIALDRLNNPQ